LNRIGIKIKSNCEICVNTQPYYFFRYQETWLFVWWKSFLQVSEVFEVNRTECDPCSVSQEGCWYHPAPWPKGSSLHALGLAAEEMRFHMPAEVTQIFQSGRPPSFSPAVSNQLAFSWPIFSHSRCFSLSKHRELVDSQEHQVYLESRDTELVHFFISGQSL